MDTPSADLLSFPEHPEDRLRLALRKLETALSAQASAVSDFRRSMDELRQATGGLAERMQGYQATLGETAEKVRQANTAARQLEATAAKLAAQG